MMKHQENNQTLFYAVITMAACMMVTVCVMIIAVFIATQRPNIVIVPIEQAPRDAVPPPVAVMDHDEDIDVPFPGLRAIRSAALPPIDQPDHAGWDSAPGFTVMTLPQQDAVPMLEEGTVSEVEVRAMTDGRHIDWRLEWEMPQPSTLVDSNVFTDAAAIQLPMSADASYMMGDENHPVYIVYWRAQWQQDIEIGYPEVVDYYPNYWFDLYWSTSMDHPNSPIPELLEDPLGKQYFVAHEAGNPFSLYDRRYPIQELKAEGYGSLTPIPESMAEGNAVWVDGKWKLVIRMPINDVHPLMDIMNNEDLSMFSVAIWDGEAENVGSRKNVSVWTPLEIEQ